MSETVDLYMIARLEPNAAVADIFCCEVFYDAVDGNLAGRKIEGWWESVVTDLQVPVSLDELDTALTAGGYTRTTSWQHKISASGAVRYIADATVQLEDPLDR